jgi:hypothetical protein
MPHLWRMVLRQSSCHSQLAFTSGIRGAGKATRVAMTIWDKFASDRVAIDRPRARAPRASPARGRWYGALSSFVLSSLALLALVPLAGCGSDGAGAVFIDPGRYTLYHCDDLATRRKALIARESELRGLMEKASESAAGSVIGSLAYRSEYDSVIAEQKLLQRNAAEKNCSFASPLQSDQTLR